MWKSQRKWLKVFGNRKLWGKLTKTFDRRSKTFWVRFVFSLRKTDVLRRQKFLKVLKTFFKKFSSGFQGRRPWRIPKAEPFAVQRQRPWTLPVCP
jgi:hypothetical protein